jgi:hypothetical protein
MKHPLCPCLERVAGRQQRWDLANSWVCPDCSRQWFACERCRHAVLLGSRGECLFCSELTVPH